MHSQSKNAAVASGVKSRRLNPVPPVVKIRLYGAIALASSSGFDHKVIAFPAKSSGTISLLHDTIEIVSRLASCCCATATNLSTEE